MSEKMLEIEVQENGTTATHSKKMKHNSKRRKAKKSKQNSNENSSSLKVDEVVSFLCDSITRDESKSLPDSAESQDEETENLPSTSKADLTHLFQNLQVHTSNNPIKPSNFTEFLNIDLLKKTNCEALSSMDELEKMKEEKLKKVQSFEPQTIPKEKMKEYFNLNLIKNSPEKSVIKHIESGSKKIVQELENSLSPAQLQEKMKKDKYFSQYFNVSALEQTDENIVSSIKATSELLVKELEKTIVDCDKTEKVSTRSRRKKCHPKSRGGTVQDETDIFDGKQKVFLNSGYLNKNQLANSQVQKHGEFETEKIAKSSNKDKKHLKNKNSNVQKEDTRFPKYLSEDELESVSKFGVLLTGIIRINQKNFKEAYITAPDKGMDILIEGLKDRNRALEGDEVFFVLKPKEHFRASADASDAQRTAVVVGIKTMNHNRKAIGTLKPMTDKNSNHLLFSPRDSRLPRIRIKKSSSPAGFLENPDSFKDRLFFAEIKEWNDVRFAEGELLQEVGNAGDIRAETTALLLKYDLDTTPYSEALNRFFPAAPYKIPESEFARREDMRKECIFTIDPATAKDLDDAVSCKKLPNGNYEVGVHISDVSYFLLEGTPLDEAVSKRATTIYLVQEVYHMLPRELCQICSLTPGEDKLTFSVLWEITPRFEIVNHRCVRGIINSCAQLSYEQVQDMLDKSPDVNVPQIQNGHGLNDVIEKVTILNEIAIYLRKQRFSNGALRIDQTKITFRLDEEGMPKDYFVYVNKESHRLIEEFMLLANITVAKRINEAFPKIAFLRCHSSPLNFVLEKLQKSLEKYGIILDISSSGALQSSLLKYSGDDIFSMARMLVLNNVLAKPMARARYYCASTNPLDDDRRHYALNVPLYTHFTSPIRRYADVMVHRLLAASLSYQQAPRWHVDDVHSVASNCNKQKYAAKMAQEMSIELFLSVYIGLQGSMICEGVVCDIKDKSFDCIILSTGAHQRIYYENVAGDLSLHQDEGIFRLKINWPKDENHEESVQIIEIFSIVKLELRRTNVLKIEARLIRCD